MNIIFLDIEGVLKYNDTYEKVYEEYINTGINNSYIDENKIKRLKEIVDETNYKIVLLSSWRKCPKLDEKRIVHGTVKLMELLDMMKKYDLSVYDITKINPYGTLEEEIDRYLENNDVDNYLVIDRNTDLLNEKVKSMRKRK